MNSIDVPVVGIGQDFLSCLASYLRPGAGQKSKLRPTVQDRAAGRPVLC